MAGLMNYEPDNHYDFLIQSLAKVSDYVRSFLFSIFSFRFLLFSSLQMKQSKEPIRWDTFIQMHENQK